jgi:hypothetical protein
MPFAAAIGFALPATLLTFAIVYLVAASKWSQLKSRKVGLITFLATWFINILIVLFFGEATQFCWWAIVVSIITTLTASQVSKKVSPTKRHISSVVMPFQTTKPDLMSYPEGFTKLEDYKGTCLAKG